MVPPSRNRVRPLAPSEYVRASSSAARYSVSCVATRLSRHARFVEAIGPIAILEPSTSYVAVYSLQPALPESLPLSKVAVIVVPALTDTIAPGRKNDVASQSPLSASPSRSARYTRSAPFVD